MKDNKGVNPFTANLESPLGREHSELYWLELEERMAQCLCGCEPLLGVGDQQLVNLQEGKR